MVGSKKRRVSGPWSLLSLFLPLLVVITICFLLHYYLPDFFLTPYLPAAFLIVYIFLTKRILEALVLSSIMCFILADGFDFFTTFGLTITEVMMDEDTGWLIVVCGLMGSIILLIEKAGGTFAFGDWVSKHAKKRKGTLIWTWILGVVIFIDDYLNSLTVGACMAPITDKHRVSREMLSYIVDSTAAPICVLIPISTWAVFASRILVSTGVTDEAHGMLFFFKTIPFNFYAWFAAIIVLLVILGAIPALGPMRKAEKRASSGGPLAPEGSESIDIRGKDASIKDGIKPRMINFILPIGVLIFSTIIFGTDMQKGVLCTLIFMFVFYIAQGLLTPEEFATVSLEGFKNMLLPIALMVLAFLFSAGSERIEFTESVINAIIPVMSPQLMAFEIFIVLGITEFITGTNWGLYIIALPIVVPLSEAIGGSTILAVSAVLSAGVFGSHICFYSDATILSSSACGCNNFDHAITQLPYGLISAFLAAISFLIAGFIIH